MKEENLDREFRKLIEKYLDEEITPEEMVKLINYYESFQQSHDWVDRLGPEHIVKENMLRNILKSVDRDVPLRVPVYRKKFYRYAVAASVVLLLSLSFLFVNRFQNADKQVVVNQEIQAGKGKAVLTLESGEEVALIEGEEYLSEAVKSNGSELVYDRSKDDGGTPSYNYLTVPRGGEFYVELSDGTKVWLNSGSQLKYPVKFAEGEIRRVDLVYGEAYFDVSPSTEHGGAKFKVHTEGQVIEVLGTEFNLKAYPEESQIYTTLVEGSVVMQSSKNKADLVMVPGQQTVLNKETNDVRVVEVDTKQITSWKNGLFSFDDKSLKEIMVVLSRWYDVDVIFDDKSLESLRFKGQLNRDQSIEDILNVIKNTNFIDAYEIKDRKIILR
ncbi:FecR family protein [Sinomicrobium sp.]